MTLVIEFSRENPTASLYRVENHLGHHDIFVLQPSSSSSLLAPAAGSTPPPPAAAQTVPPQRASASAAAPAPAPAPPAPRMTMFHGRNDHKMFIRRNVINKKWDFPSMDVFHS